MVREMPPQPNRMKQLVAATAFTLAASALAIPSQNMAYAGTGANGSTAVKNCVRGAAEEIKEQIKKTDAVGGTLVIIDLAVTGGTGTALYGAVSAVVGCLKGPSRPNEDAMQRYFRESMTFSP